MDFRGQFTETEKHYLQDGFDEWVVWKEVVSETYSIYYAWRSDWNKDNRIVEHTFKDFVVRLDEYEGHYPTPSAKSRFDEKPATSEYDSYYALVDSPPGQHVYKRFPDVGR